MRDIVRQRVLKKCGYACVNCDAKERLEVDHIIPLSKGGEHSEFNFQILCRHCNATKKDKFPYLDILNKFVILDESPEYFKLSTEFSFFEMPPMQFMEFSIYAFNKHAEFWGLDGKSAA